MLDILESIRIGLVAWKDAAPAAGALTAIVSATVALLVFNHTRAANRRRATLDMVMRALLDETAKKNGKRFRELVKKDKNTDDCFKIESLAAEDKKGDDDRATMLAHLNVYELISLGIKRKIFDEAFYKRWFHNQFISDYEGAEPFIKKMQEGKSSIYCECSFLYANWNRNGHPEITPSRFKMAWWGLTRNDKAIDDARARVQAR